MALCAPAGSIHVQATPIQLAIKDLHEEHCKLLGTPPSDNRFKYRLPLPDHDIETVLSGRQARCFQRVGTSNSEIAGRTSDRLFF
jgi:hypothetical protein